MIHINGTVRRLDLLFNFVTKKQSTLLDQLAVLFFILIFYCNIYSLYIDVIWPHLKKIYKRQTNSPMPEILREAGNDQLRVVKEAHAVCY